jgi:hypothetical protein
MAAALERDAGADVPPHHLGPRPRHRPHRLRAAGRFASTRQVLGFPADTDWTENIRAIIEDDLQKPD